MWLIFSRAASRSRKIPSNQLQAIAAYQRVLELDPDHAAAHINLGTLYYNRQEYRTGREALSRSHRDRSALCAGLFRSRQCARRNRTGRRSHPDLHTALQLAPTYADAHYNLALAYEKMKEPRKALQHWRAYVKLDTLGPGSVHARNQISAHPASRRAEADSRRKQ